MQKIAVCLDIWLLPWLILRSNIPIALRIKRKFCAVLVHFRGKCDRNAFLSNVVERKCRGYGFAFQKDVLALEADSCAVPAEEARSESHLV